MLVWSQYSEAGIGRPGKVTICHKADDGKYVQITVSTRALPAHLKHGDCAADDGVACTVDGCDADLGCIHTPDNVACDDGDACTIDTCDPSPGSAGCVYEPVNCDDNNACTADSCDPATGCRNIDNLTCGACCLPDDSCQDRSPADECTAAGGEPQGAGTECATTQCCLPLATGDCVDPADCCDANAVCGGDQTCCLLGGDTGCTDALDCCTGHLGAICDAGKCCVPNGVRDLCIYPDNTPCCHPNAVCGRDGTTCCINLATTGCTDASECCLGHLGAICDAGTCCVPNGVPFLCIDDADCCNPSDSCNGGTCEATR